MSVENPMENFNNLAEEAESEELSEEATFKDYMEELDLKPEDFDKKVIDIGAGSAEFAKWAKEHGVSSDIYSLEPEEELLERSKGIKGSVEEIPFKDGEFDMVISHAAIPQIFSGLSAEVQPEKIRQSLSEMMRVVKKGGEIRFGLITHGENLEFQKKFWNNLNKELEELGKKEGVVVEEIPNGYSYSRFDKEGKPLDKEPKFLIKIKKL